MPDTSSALPEVGSAATLLTLGISDRQLRELRRDGHLERIRHGYYARPDARRDVVRAVRLGGRLTAHSALRAHGVWCPPGDTRLHVAVSAHAHALRDPDTGGRLRARDDVVVHYKCQPPARRRHADGIVPLPLAVRHLPASLDKAHLAAVLDSAVRLRLTTRAQLSATCGEVPRLRRALARIDTSAESGTESVARERMLEAGLDPRPQVWFGRYRVDFLLAGRVVVEVDGHAFHDDESSFERDRRKAADLTRRGLHVLHFSYAQVMFDWPSCLAAIRVALALPA